MPGGVRVFGGVERIFAGGAFASADGSVQIEFGEENAAFRDAIHGCFERSEKLQVDFANSEIADLHAAMIL